MKKSEKVRRIRDILDILGWVLLILGLFAGIPYEQGDIAATFPPLVKNWITFIGIFSGGAIKAIHPLIKILEGHLVRLEEEAKEETEKTPIQ